MTPATSEGSGLSPLWSKLPPYKHLVQGSGLPILQGGKTQTNMASVTQQGKGCDGHTF